MRLGIGVSERRIGRQISASQEVHRGRSSVVCVVEHDGYVGVGEVCPGLAEINGDPSLESVLAHAKSIGVRRIHDLIEHSPKDFRWADVRGLFGEQAQDRWVAALAESAILDLTIQRAAATWEEFFDSTPVATGQITGSLIDGFDVHRHNDAVTRVRLKCDADTSVAALTEAATQVSVPLIIDANGVVLHEEQLDHIRRHGVMLEQAWHVGDWTTPAQLHASGVVLSHDESIRSLRDVRACVNYVAGGNICLKPARLGGWATTRDLARRAGEMGLTYYIGGFFESPLSRYRHAILASASGAGPSDVLVDESSPTLDMAMVAREALLSAVHFDF